MLGYIKKKTIGSYINQVFHKCFSYTVDEQRKSCETWEKTFFVHILVCNGHIFFTVTELRLFTTIFFLNRTYAEWQMELVGTLEQLGVCLEFKTTMLVVFETIPCSMEIRVITLQFSFNIVRVFSKLYCKCFSCCNGKNWHPIKEVA